MTLRAFLVTASLVLSVTIGWVISLGATPAAKTAAQRERPLIGLSLDTLKEERWQGDRDRFTARAAELGAEVLCLSASGDDAQQIRDVEGLISRGVDAMVIVPHDGQAMAKAVTLCRKAGIPVLSYDRLIRDSSVDIYLSFDNVRVGELQARYLMDTLKPSPARPARLIRLYGARTDNNAVLFKQGQDEALKPFIDSGAVKVVWEDWTEDWKPENAKRIVNAAITRHGAEFDAILASNDGTAGGAIQALREEKITGKLVTGQDAELVAVQRIASGEQAMTIYKPLKTLARGAAEVAVSLARRQVVVARTTINNGLIDVPSRLFDVVTVTRDNIPQTVVADGFHSYDAVYSSVPQANRPPRP